MPHVREREPNPDELPQDTDKKAGAAERDTASSTEQPSDADGQTDEATLDKPGA
jgi:hypothetical protein